MFVKLKWKTNWRRARQHTRERERVSDTKINERNYNEKHKSKIVPRCIPMEFVQPKKKSIGTHTEKNEQGNIAMRMGHLDEWRDADKGNQETPTHIK